MKKRLIIAVLLAGVVVSSPSYAALVPRTDGMYYDTVLGITWLPYTNLGAGSPYDDGLVHNDGYMSWGNAMAWADSLVYGGYSDWRLPKMLDTGTPGCNVSYSGTDCGWNVQTYSNGVVYNELAFMYYTNLALTPLRLPDGTDTPPGYTSNPNPAPFIGPFNFFFWYSTEPANNATRAFAFQAANGGVTTLNKVSCCEFAGAWAVRDGDVAGPASVPEPASLGLVGLGLAGLGWSRRRRSM